MQGTLLGADGGSLGTSLKEQKVWLRDPSREGEVTYMTLCFACVS